MNPSTWTVVFTLLILIPINIGWASQPEEAGSIVPKVLYQSPFTQYKSNKNFERKSWYDANKQVQNTGSHGGHHSMPDMGAEPMNHSEKSIPSQPSPNTHEHNHHD